jgi:tRNA pseudouridine13 synthase
VKLKRIAEDFRVEEVVSGDVGRVGGGPFALYRLTKQSLGTLEAIDAIRKRWKLPRERVSFAGLKDKHALTTQYLTIESGPRRGLPQEHLELEYLGQTERAIHARDIVANRFAIVIRDLDASELERMEKSLAIVAHDGVPNYFDNQRFGSLGTSGEFIAKPWCLGDYERALWLALADENIHDRPEERQAKDFLRQHWGDWDACARRIERSPWRDIVSYLNSHPGDFRRAIALAPHDLRSIWLAAFQSHLWNQILAALIRRICRPEQCVMHSIGRRELPLFTELDAEQRQVLQGAKLPLPSARLHLDEGPLKSLYDQVLDAEGMEQRQVRVKYPRDSFFSKGERVAVLLPADLAHSAAEDELYPGRRKLTLSFELPRGGYATMVIKRVTGISDDRLSDDETIEG